MGDTKWAAGYAAGKASLQAELNWHREEAARPRTTLEGIAEYCSGDGRTLGAIERVAAIQNTAARALALSSHDRQKP